MLVTPQETFLELEEAADALGMHPVTLRERAAAGIIPGFKLGKEWRFRTTRIAAYAAQKEAQDGLRSADGVLFWMCRAAWMDTRQATQNVG